MLLSEQCFQWVGVGGDACPSPQFLTVLVFVLLEDMIGTVTKLPDRTKCGKTMLTKGIGV